MMYIEEGRELLSINNPTYNNNKISQLIILLICYGRMMSRLDKIVPV